MVCYEPFQLDEKEIGEQFTRDYKIKFNCYRMDSEEEEYLVNVLKICLIEVGKEPLFDFFSYIMRELLNNAKKANTKRVYFEDIELDINDKNGYKTGMMNFKRIPQQKLDYYVGLHREKGYYVDTFIAVKDEMLIISITNNVPVLDKELEIINKKMENAHEFKSIEEALTVVFNNQEGAGLGVIISILMLKKLGLSRNALRIERVDDTTVSSVSIPLSFITVEHKAIVNRVLIEEIDRIPHFPEQLIELQKQLNDPEVNIKQISALISKDAALTAEIIRFSNSAIYSTGHKLISLLESVKIIGLRGVSNLIYTHATRVILNSRYEVEKVKQCFQHSYKVAYMAFFLARKYSLAKHSETIYIAAILHDLGKIVMSAVNPEVLDNVNSLCHEKGIPIRIIEELTNGYNHSAVGALIAKKWHFPEELISAIKYHHDPLECPEKLKTIVYCIYLADLIADEELEVEQLYNETKTAILKFFNIGSLEHFRNIYKSLSENWEDQLKVYN